MAVMLADGTNRPKYRNGIANLAVAVCAVLWLGGAAGAQEKLPETITMIKGTTRPLSLAYTIGQIAIGDPEVADFKVSENQREVLVNAKTTGSTNLVMWDNKQTKRDTIQINVVANLDRLASELGELFRGVEGVHVKVAGNRVVVEGAVFAESDYEFVRKNASGNPELILFQVQLNPEAIRLLAQEIERAIGRQELKTRVIKDKILLEGRVNSEADRDRAISIANTYTSDRVIAAIDVVKEGSRFEAGKQVHLDVKVMKIFNEDLSRLGIRWPSEIGSAKPDDGSIEFEQADTSADQEELPGKFFSNLKTGELYYRFFGTITNLIPTVNLLVQDGGGTIVGNPRMVIKAGDTGKETVAGGEYPIVTGSGISGYTVEYKEFGFVVEATPMVNDGDDVDLKIKAEMLQLIGTVTAFELPLFSKELVDTRVNIPKGDSLVIGGVIANTLRQQWSRLPGIGRIPVLNYLFGSKQTQLEQSEVVLFVTPTVVDPGRAVQSDRELLDGMRLKIDSQPKFTRTPAGK
ncbi:MAG: pilus assembly protein N-terminal domain-containing protein [Candidatus Schekmanbacteria bacterium]|nr:pilus assembly protein N-terminal domain-containing protein [Candidatus Schekmanbacteria bacterium]